LFRLKRPFFLRGTGRRAGQGRCVSIGAVRADRWIAPELGGEDTDIDEWELSSASLGVERGGGADEGLQGRFVDVVALADIDGAPGVAVQAGVEQAGWVGQCGTFGEGEFTLSL
jgi:hypothetical protein